MEQKTYKNDDITVVWEPSKCIHSALCFNGLPRVFNPRKKPWITMEGSTSEAIIHQISKCPSGALSVKKNDEIEGNQNKEIENQQSIKIKVTSGGPYLVEGVFNIEYADGVQRMTNQVTALCRCGQSSKKPFCDGSHRSHSFDQEQL